ncbi:MAG: LptF/LptG family permease [Alphaproteobacteria bacterium]|nr:LptF/LptG family permease [Alphaproteobacteria bacterium]
MLSFDGEDRLANRIDAESASLEDNNWILKDAILQEPGAPKPREIAAYSLPTDLTPQDIENSFGSPESMSFWQLQGHIKTLEESGFDATRCVSIIKAFLPSRCCFWPWFCWRPVFRCVRPACGER